MNEKVEFLEINEDQERRIEVLRNIFSDDYAYIDEYCKPSRETSLGITKLEEAQFWLIKGITREENMKNKIKNRRE